MVEATGLDPVRWEFEPLQGHQFIAVWSSGQLVWFIPRRTVVQIHPLQPHSKKQVKKMKVILEIRPGEGGADAKLLVEDQARIYLRYAERHGMAVDIDQDNKS